MTTLLDQMKMPGALSSVNPLQSLLEAKGAIEQAEARVTMMAGQLADASARADGLERQLSAASDRLADVSALSGHPYSPLGTETPLLAAARALSVHCFGSDIDKAKYLRSRGWLENARGWWTHRNLNLTDILFATAVQKQVARDAEPFKAMLKEHKLA